MCLSPCRLIEQGMRACDEITAMPRRLGLFYLQLRIAPAHSIHWQQSHCWMDSTESAPTTCEFGTEQSIMRHQRHLHTSAAAKMWGETGVVLTGPDAAKAVDWIFTANMRKPAGNPYLKLIDKPFRL